MKKHLVIVTTNFANGGTERRASVLANEFVKSGYNVSYLVMNKVYDDVVYQLDKSIELVCVNQFKGSLYNESKIWIDKRYLMLSRKQKILKLLNKNNYAVTAEKNLIKKLIALRSYMLSNKDAVYLVFGLSEFQKICYASKGINCTLVYSEINAPQITEKKYKEDSFHRVICKLLSKADVCVFQTLDQKDYYRKYTKCNWVIIRNPILAHLPLPYTGERRKTIVNYCRTHPQKNLFLLVDAFSRFVTDFPEYGLEIFGSTSTVTAEAYKNKLLLYISELGLNDRITVFEATPDVHERIKDCGMFVSSSDYEGLSNSMIEAMAMGLPCVCTDCIGGGAREMIEDGENGLLVPVADAQAMCYAMKRMITETNLAERCSLNALKIRDELSVENIVKQWINVITNIYIHNR